MLRLVCALVGLATLSATAWADPPLAGNLVVTASHGQPFCTDKGQLLGLLQASIAEVPAPITGFPSCGYVGDGAAVTVLEDLSPGTRFNHVVRARAVMPLFGAVDGFTFSAGLYP